MRTLTPAQRFFVLLAALLYLLAGMAHFLNPAAFEQIVPPALPSPRLLIYLSGIAEISGAIGLLISPLRRAAAWGLTALLGAVFPANIYMASANIQVSAHAVPQWALWARLALQPLLIWWILWCTNALRRGSNYPESHTAPSE